MNGPHSAEERLMTRGRQVQLEEIESLRGWYPVVFRENQLWWRFFGEKKFSEPFFFDTLTSLGQAEKLVLQTGLDALDSLDNTLAPTAFIFHISRCGSTLLTQLLASLPRCVVMSEPPAINSFLSAHHARPQPGRDEQTLRKIVAALGQQRFAQERHLFIKLDSWHIGSLPLFRRTFPDTPCIFLYREPGAVMQSHRRQRGRQMVPGLVDAAMLELDPAPLQPGDLDGYCVKVLKYFFSAAARQSDELILIHYRQLPQIVWTELLDFFALDCTADEIASMKLRSGSHSKNAEKFSGDPLPIAEIAGDTSSAELYPYYEKLEQMRLAQNLFQLDFPLPLAGEGLGERVAQ